MWIIGTEFDRKKKQFSVLGCVFFEYLYFMKAIKTHHVNLVKETKKNAVMLPEKQSAKDTLC